MNSLNDQVILLIEDNVNDAELAIRALKKNNPERSVIHLMDGEEALDYFFPDGDDSPGGNVKPPKVILLDLKLPKLMDLKY